MYREYKEFHFNDSNVKGRIDISRHIKENPFPNGRIAYSTTEYTTDNPVNHLILKAIEYIQKKYKNIYNGFLRQNFICKRAINEIKNDLAFSEHQSTQKIIKNANKKIVKNIYKSYEPLRETAIMILKRLGINSLKDSNEQASGVLIYIPKLWENFLEKELIKKVDLNFDSQKEIQILEGKRTIKPDFLLEDKIVLDAKYKQVWGEEYKQGNSWSDGTRYDVNQVLSYMFVCNCKIGGVIFPIKSNKVTSNKELIVKLKVSDKSEDNHFLAIPYIIPQGVENADDFVKEITNTNDQLVKEIKEILA